MKLYIAITFASVVTLASLISTANAVNATWGVVGWRDQLLYQKNITVPSKWLRVVTANVTYPEKGYIKYHRITAVRAIDRSGKKTGGHPLMVHGGPGYNTVIVRFISDSGHGLKYLLQIFGV